MTTMRRNVRKWSKRRTSVHGPTVIRPLHHLLSHPRNLQKDVTPTITNTAYPKAIVIVLCPATRFGFPKELRKTASLFGTHALTTPVIVAGPPSVWATALMLSVLPNKENNVLNVMTKKLMEWKIKIRTVVHTRSVINVISIIIGQRTSFVNSAAIRRGWDMMETFAAMATSMRIFAVSRILSYIKESKIETRSSNQILFWNWNKKLKQNTYTLL